MDINIKIADVVEPSILNMKLIDIRCKHVLNLDEKAALVLKLSNDIGYQYCHWGVYENRGNDFDSHMNIISKMEKDNYCHALRIVICNYNFSKEKIIWVDNIHSAVMYLRKYGSEVQLKEIPFYIVDLTDDTIYVKGYKDSLRTNISDILGAIISANTRKEWSNSEELININYTLRDFIDTNKNFIQKKEKE